MAKKISLFGRKRIGELGDTHDDVAEKKRDELLALKLQEVNTDAKSSGTLQDLPLHMIKPDENQPRKTFRNIDSMADSIREKGIIQPIIVSTKNTDGIYTIIAGERRYRAATKAGLPSIPCIIREENDANIVILQLLENDQRENVSPLEESDALVKLIEEMRLSKWQVAKELGHDPAWISIRLGLQQASDDIKKLVKDGLIEDVRTLHELRKYEAEDLNNAKRLINKIRKDQVSGSYRQVIANARKARKVKKKPATGKASVDKVTKVKAIEQVGNELILYTKDNDKMTFTVPKKVMQEFISTVEAGKFDLKKVLTGVR